MAVGGANGSKKDDCSEVEVPSSSPDPPVAVGNREYSQIGDVDGPYARSKGGQYFKLALSHFGLAKLIFIACGLLFVTRAKYLVTKKKHKKRVMVLLPPSVVRCQLRSLQVATANEVWLEYECGHGVGCERGMTARMNVGMNVNEVWLGMNVVTVLGFAVRFGGAGWDLLVHPAPHPWAGGGMH